MMQGVRGLRGQGVRALLVGVAVHAFLQGAGAQVEADSLPLRGETQEAVDSSIYLSEATVVGRRNEPPATLPYQLELVSDSARRQVQALTTADALANLSGVYVQKSQLGGGSPVLRGFEANRVLLVVDGVRMNNAIYRNGHLQNAITVDPNVLDRIEVIYGAGALTYGSDAIGGVVHFRTHTPDYRPEGGTAGYVQTNLASAARAVNLAGGIDYGGARWAATTQLSYSRFGDLRAGGNRPAAYGDFGLRTEYVAGDEVVANSDPQRLVGSGYTQYNLLQKLRIRLTDRLELTANLQFSTTGDVPRYDALTERRGGQLRWARWDYGPQTRALTSLRLTDRQVVGLYDVASYLLSYQFIEEDRLQRRLGDPLLQEDRVNVGSWNLQVDYRKRLGATTNLHYGIDGRAERVVSEAIPTTLPTRYPSRGSGLAGGGAYIELRRQLATYWQLHGGLRYSYQRLTATFGTDDPVAWPEAYVRGVANPSDAVTGAVGARYRREAHGLRLLLAQGFRAPNVDDFAKFREQGDRIQVPNLTLRPERSLTAEAAYTLTGDRLRYELTAYGTRLRDVIIRGAGSLPDGSAFFVSRGDTLFVDTNVNAERAWVYGLDLALAYRVGQQWELRTDLHALRGRRRQAASDGAQLLLPQAHVPPPYGRLSVSYRGGRWQGSVRLAGQLEKPLEAYAVNAIEGTAATGYTLDRIGTPDNLDLTPNEAGTPGWWTLNLYGSYRVSDRLGVQLKAENVLDRFYQPFASGIPAAGVDVGLGVRWGW